ncbi:MAG: DUF1275 family protein [Nocardioidaceae bacterium]|nr:DUF1275 family protein [Nocardioidaceae bacterium]
MTARTRSGLVLLLALTSGATDAIGLLALGGSFTSVMTGNLVLMGVAGAEGDGSLALHTAGAIVGFVLGAAVGSFVARTPQTGDGIWPVAVTRAMLLEAALLALYAVVWWATGHGDHAAFLVTPMLFVNAMALGLQSSAIQRFGVSGLSTTYLTGTLTTVVIRLVHGHGLRAVSHSLGLLGGLVLGACLGAFAVHHAAVLVPLVQLVPLVVVLAVVLVRARTREPVPVG